MTFMRRGSTHYFDLEFFLRLSRDIPDQVLVVLAEEGHAGLNERGFLRH